MKITLINLMTKNDHAILNLGALYIAASILRGGHEVNFIDLVRSPRDYPDIERIIKDFNPGLIAFSGIITTYYQLEPLSNRLKRSFGGIPQIAGGSVGSSALKLIESYTGVDFVCTGEGEEAILRLLEKLGAKDERWADVPNIFYRDGRVFKRSVAQHLYIDDLDTIPFPSYDLVDMEFYIDYATAISGKQLSYGKIAPRVMPMIFTRGCPFSCSFCYRLIRKWRHHSAENIISHLKMVKDRYGVNGIYLNDELIFVDRQWFISLCKAITGSGLDIKFVCGGGKPNLITGEMLCGMKEAGFRRIGYGIESGSPKILKLMKKEVTREENYNALSLTFKHGLASGASFVFGHPGEGKATVKETFDFIDSLHRLQERSNVLGDSFQTWFATPYPGAPLYEYAVSKGLIPDERDYLLRVTGQSNYLINLSDFSSVNRLRSTVHKGLAILDIKKFLRRKQYGSAFRQFSRLIVLYMVYLVTLGRCVTLTDMMRALNVPLKRFKAGHIRDKIREKREVALGDDRCFRC